MSRSKRVTLPHQYMTTNLRQELKGSAVKSNWTGTETPQKRRLRPGFPSHSREIWLKLVQCLEPRKKNTRKVFIACKRMCYNVYSKNYKKGVYLAPLIMKLKDVDLSIKEPGPPTGPGRKGASGIDNNRCELQIKKKLDRINTLLGNMTKLYSLFWWQCTTALQQRLCVLEYFDGKDIEFNTKWLLKKLS